MNKPPDSSLTSDISSAFLSDSGRKGSLHPLLPASCFILPPAKSQGQDGSFAQQSASSPAQAEPVQTSVDVDLPAVGAILDKYRFEELVGKGAFAAVYRATHLLLKVPVAIKLLRPKAVRRTAGLAALLCEEARFAARINHPNVVRIFDVTHTSTITYVVMEYIDGINLAKRLETEGPLPPRLLLGIGMEVADGLKAALAQGLIHRDIKPSNILMTRTGAAKIVDLGLALAVKKSELAAGDDLAPSSSLTVVGTPGYMAPEQGLAPSQVDFRADIYALGATLYHAALGVPPFPLDDSARCMAMHRREPVPAPDSVVKGFPRELSRLLQWMLAKSPSARPASYDILLKAMRGVLKTLPNKDSSN